MLATSGGLIGTVARVGDVGVERTENVIGAEDVGRKRPGCRVQGEVLELFPLVDQLVYPLVDVVALGFGLIVVVERTRTLCCGLFGDASSQRGDLVG